MTRGRIATAVALAAVVALIVVVIVSTRPARSPASSGGRSSGAGTAAVTMRNLVQTDTESGTLSYADPQTVYNRLSGTVTALPAVGQLIRPGQALYRIDGKPVLLMDGRTPAFRDLDSADSDGSDILQLNRNLVALGFNPEGIVVDDAWQTATTAGVDALQASLGESETGKLALGQIVFLPGPQLVSALDTGIGSTGAGGGTSNTSAPVSPDAEFVSLTTGPTTSTGSTPTPPGSSAPGAPPKKRPSAGSIIARLIKLLRAEAAELRAATAALRAAHGSAGGSPHGSPPAGSGSGSPSPSSPSPSPSSSAGSGIGSGSGSGAAGGSGAGGSSGTAILQTSSARLIATVDLDASKQSEARVGEHVSVELPSGTTITGVVSAVSSVAQSSNSSGSGGNGNSGNGNSGNGNSGSSSATVPVRISLPRHLPGAGLDQAAVSVGFVEAVADHVLSVPVTALVATGGGAYAIQEAAAPHDLIPVTTGLFAAGYVQVSGAGVVEGLSVTDSEG